MNFSKALMASLALLIVIIITSFTLEEGELNNSKTTQQEALSSNQNQNEFSANGVSREQEQRPKNKQHAKDSIKVNESSITIKQIFQADNPPNNISVPSVKENESAQHNSVTLEIAREAANIKDWELFLEVSKKIKEMPEYVHPMTLTMAIRENAPQHVFEALLARGEAFLPQHLTRTAIGNKLELLKRLIPLGLNVHAELPNGDNVINILMKSLSSPQVFEFLLQQNVAIRPGSNGKDPLLAALDASLSNNKAVFYVSKLIENGVQPNAEHYSLVTRIKESNPKAYNLIESNIPELLEAP